MSELVINDLHAEVEDRTILRGVDLTIRSGEVHAVMGPNGSGKSTLAHVIAGRPGYLVTGGEVTLDGQDLLAMEPFERARAGLFLAMQYPVEVPGVSVRDVVAEAMTARGLDVSGVADRLAEEAGMVGLDLDLLDRPLNVDLSGGEKKRTETVQLAVLEPKVAFLDEIDSGLDVDALAAVSRRVELLSSAGLGVVVVTHYNRLLEELRADVVHVFAGGRIVESGGPELAAELEVEGYARWADDQDRAGTPSAPERPVVDDPFFAGPL